MERPNTACASFQRAGNPLSSCTGGETTDESPTSIEASFPLAGNKSLSSDESSAEEEELVPHGGKRAKRILDLDPHFVVATPCCHLDCVGQISGSDVKALQAHIASFSETQRRQFLINAIEHGSETCSASRKPTFRASVVIPVSPRKPPVHLCSKALSRATGTGHSRIETLIKHHRRGEDIVATHGQAHRNELSDAASHALGYIRDYVESNAELVPTTGKRKLRQCVSWEHLHNAYCDLPGTQEYFKLHNDSGPVSVSTFLRLFHTHFKDVTATRRTPLGKCDLCFELDEKLSLDALKLDERRFLRQQLHDHLDLVTAERQEYHYARATARPLSGTLSIIFDGARTIGFPCLFPTPKMFAGTERVQLPMYGIHCHTFNERRLYFSPPSSSHGSNFVISALARFLCDLIRSDQEDLPRRQLRLQCDNASENKCCYMMAFAGFLISQNIFESVYITMLPPGHGHEDIDGIFGAFSHLLHNSFANCYTLPDVRQVAATNQKISFRPEQFEFLDRVVDWKSYLATTGACRLANITFYHVFELAKARNGQIQLRYKEWNTRGQWHGSFDDSSAVPLFRNGSNTDSIGLSNPTSVSTIPLSCTDPVVSSMIHTLLRNLRTLPPAVGTPERIGWFESLLSHSSPPQELLEAIGCVLFGFPKQPESLCSSAIPPFTSTFEASNRVIVPKPLSHVPFSAATSGHQLLPDPFRNRRLSIADLVIVAKNPADDKSFPDDRFWVAEVLDSVKPSVKEPRVHIVWYGRDGKTYRRLSPTGSNVCDILISTILFSGFQLTSSGQLMEDFEQMILREIDTK